MKYKIVIKMRLSLNTENEDLPSVKWLISLSTQSLVTIKTGRYKCLRQS